MAQLWYWCISAMPHKKSEFHCDYSLCGAWNPHFFGGFLLSSSNLQVQMSRFDDPLTRHKQSIFFHPELNTDWKDSKKIVLLHFSVTYWLEIRSLYFNMCFQVDSIILWAIKYYCSVDWVQTLCLYFFSFSPFIHIMVIIIRKEKVTVF